MGGGRPARLWQSGGAGPDNSQQHASTTHPVCHPGDGTAPWMERLPCESRIARGARRSVNARPPAIHKKGRSSRTFLGINFPRANGEGRGHTVLQCYSVTVYSATVLQCRKGTGKNGVRTQGKGQIRTEK